MNKSELITKLKQQLYQAKEERNKTSSDPNAKAAHEALKEYQKNRLKITHLDLFNNPNTREAANFFLNEVYGAKDLKQRDKDIEKLIPLMETAFPLNTLEVITNAMVLDALSETLDSQMARKLGSQFNESQYIEEFKSVGSQEIREKQLMLVESLGYALCKLVRIPLLSTTIKMMRVPAKLAGLYDLHVFLETGFNVFKNTKNPENFIRVLVEREREILNNIYSQTNKPFMVKM